MRPSHVTNPLPRVALLTALASPARASAYAPEPEVTRAPSATVHVVGEATIRDAHATVRCSAHTLFWRSARCQIEARYEVLARGDVTLDASAMAADVVRFDGAAGRTSNLRAGQSVRVTVSARRELEVRRRWSGGPWVQSPMVTRHPFLGDTQGVELRGDSGAVVLLSGEALTVDGALTLDSDGDGEVRIAGGASEEPFYAGERARPRAEPEAPTSIARSVIVTLSLPAPREASGPLRNGGPVLALGWRGPLNEGDGRFLLRGAWEVSLYEYAFISASIETDFDSLMESFVVDVASPGLLVIVPSVRVGAGVVARQLGPRPADFALRLRAGANLLPAGGDVDFDYWPATGSWTLSVTGRFSP